MFSISASRLAGTQGLFAHEAARIVQIADTGVGAEALRYQRCRGIAELHAFRGRPAESQCADETCAVSVAASRRVDDCDIVRRETHALARSRQQAAVAAHR